MILYKSTTQERVIVHSGSPIVRMLMAEGFTNITPKRTDKQVAQSKRFMAMGMLSRTDVNLTQCKNLATFTAEDLVALNRAKTVLMCKLNSLRQGG